MYPNSILQKNTRKKKRTVLEQPKLIPLTLFPQLRKLTIWKKDISLKKTWRKIVQTVLDLEKIEVEKGGILKRDREEEVENDGVEKKLRTTSVESALADVSHRRSHENHKFNCLGDGEPLDI